MGVLMAGGDDIGKRWNQLERAIAWAGDAAELRHYLALEKDFLKRYRVSRLACYQRLHPTGGTHRFLVEWVDTVTGAAQWRWHKQTRLVRIPHFHKLLRRYGLELGTLNSTAATYPDDLPLCVVIQQDCVRCN